MENPNITQETRDNPKKQSRESGNKKNGNICQNRPFFKKLGLNIKKFFFLKEFIRFWAVKTPFLSKTAPISRVFK